MLCLECILSVLILVEVVPKRLGKIFTQISNFWIVGNCSLYTRSGNLWPSGYLLASLSILDHMANVKDDRLSSWPSLAAALGPYSCYTCRKLLKVTGLERRAFEWETQEKSAGTHFLRHSHSNHWAVYARQAHMTEIDGALEQTWFCRTPTTMWRKHLRVSVENTLIWFFRMQLGLFAASVLWNIPKFDPSLISSMFLVWPSVFKWLLRVQKL